MARSYQARQHIRCWKQHSCVSCGAVYRYIFDRQIIGTATTAQGATQAAQKQAQAALVNQVDPWPCPHCGMYQPDMLNQNQAKRHGQLTMLTLAALVGVLLLIGFANLPSHWFPLIVLGSGALIAAGHFWTALRNPNQNLSANRDRANKAIAQGKLILDSPGGGSQPSRGSGSKQLPAVALAALAIGVLSSPLAEVVRVAGGWPLNQAVSPPVAGPGDTIRVYLPQTISSVGGYWKANARAGAVGAEDRSFPASSRQADWGDEITTSSKQRTSTSSLWADVTVPDEPSLAGQTQQLQVDLGVTYPRMSGFNTFREVRESYSRTLDLKLAPPGSGRVYYRLWLGGMVACGILLLAAGGVLARRKRAGVSSTQMQLIPMQA